MSASSSPIGKHSSCMLQEEQRVRSSSTFSGGQLEDESVGMKEIGCDMVSKTSGQGAAMRSLYLNGALVSYLPSWLPGK
ncbi:MAG TPA: hypothetical protein VM571_13505 [Noviherbaspirillum sp.]|nr:hypothetical protein [Noviherbaspirillum sp.]